MCIKTNKQELPPGFHCNVASLKKAESLNSFNEGHELSGQMGNLAFVTFLTHSWPIDTH